MIIVCQNHIVCDHWSYMLPHFAYMSTKLFPTKTSDSKPLWTICWWTHLPFSRATMLAQAISIRTNVTKSGRIPSCCICPNSSSACISHVPILWFSKWPHLKTPSCWKLSKHPRGSDILHTCPPSCSPQRHLLLNHFEWSGDEHAGPLQVQPHWHMHWAPSNS